MKSTKNIRHLRRILATVCCLMLTAALLFAAPTQALAADTVSGVGSDGMHWTLSLSDGLLTIEGSGVLRNCDWEKYRYQVQSVRLENGITDIESNVFAYHESLTRVRLPDTLTTIGNQAFSGCRLVTVTIPSATTYIHPSAFAECSLLTAIYVSDKNPAYTDRDGVLYRKDMTTLWRCPGGYKGSLTLPDTVQTIHPEAFRDCWALTAIETGEKHPHFSSKDGVLFSKDQTTLYRYPMDREGTYRIPDSVTHVVPNAFYRCGGTNVILPERLESIGEYAFHTCWLQDALVLPETVSFIGEYAFYRCMDLTSISLPNGITTVAPYAFQGCHSVKSLQIPASVKELGICAFNGCTNLTDVYYSGTQSQWNALLNNSFFQTIDDLPPERVDIHTNTPYYSQPEYRIYTSIPYSFITSSTEFEVLVEAYANGKVVLPEHGYEVMLKKINCDVELLNSRSTEHGWVFTFKTKPGAWGNEKIVFKEVSSGQHIPLPMVWDYHNMDIFRCTSPRGPEPFTADYFGNNYNCTWANGTHQLTFDVYNPYTACGAVLAYDARGSLLKAVPLLPVPRSSDAIRTVDGVSYFRIDPELLPELPDDMIYWEEFNGPWWYLSEEYAHHTAVSLELPDNASVTLSMDGSLSPYPALFTGMHLFTQSVLTQLSQSVTGQPRQAAFLALIDTVLQKTTVDQRTAVGKRLADALTADSGAGAVFTAARQILTDAGVDYIQVITAALQQNGCADAADLSAAVEWTESDCENAAMGTPFIAAMLNGYRYSLNSRQTELRAIAHPPQTTLIYNGVTFTSESYFDDELISIASLFSTPEELDSLPYYTKPADMDEYVVYTFDTRNAVTPSAPVTVRVPVPDIGNGRTYTVYVNGDQITRTAIPSRTSNGYITFTLTGYDAWDYYYIIVPSPAPVLSLPVILALAAAVFAAGTGIGVFLYRRRRAA